MTQYICIEGNIGSGKTSLAKKLAHHYKADLIEEEFLENPFLSLFYKNKKKYAYALEYSFLLDRIRQLKAFKKTKKSEFVFCDYHLEKCLNFAHLNLNAAQFKEFKAQYNLFLKIAPQPQVLVFLHLSTPNLLKNIKKRGRGLEQQIKANYLSSLNKAYSKSSQKKRKCGVFNFYINNASPANYHQIFLIITEQLGQKNNTFNLNFTLD